MDGTNPQVLVPNLEGVPQLMVAVPPAPPKLGFTPSSYDYGEVTAGQPASQAFTLANTGATASGTLAVTLTGQAGFTKSGDTCTGTSLGPGQSCTVSVQFTPASYAPLSATLTAADKDPAATAAVALTGTGMGPLCWTNNPTGGGFPQGTVLVANHDGSRQRALFSGQDWPAAVAVGGGHLYWVTKNVDTADGNGTIWRANLDGSDPRAIATGESFAASLGGGVAVDASHVYWTADGNGTIWRANLDGTGAAVIVTWQSGPQGVAVDGGFIYWASTGETPNSGTINRAGLDGGNPTPIATGQNQPVGVAVDGSHVYWATLGNGEIIQASLDGSNAKPIVTGQNQVAGVAVDADHLYWAKWLDGQIVQAGLDGSNPRLVASGQANPTGLAVGWWVSVPRFLYLASFGEGIFVANLNASNPRLLVGSMGGQTDTPAVAVDANYLYWATQKDVSGGGGTITRANLDGSGQRYLVIGSNNPTGVAVDANYSTGRPRTTARARSTGPAWTAATRRPSSPGWRTSRAWWRSAPATSTGPAIRPGPARSTGPAWTAATHRPSSEARTDHGGWRSMPTTSTGPTLGTPQLRHDQRAGLDGSDPQAIVTGLAYQPGMVAVGASHIYWAGYPAGSGTINRAGLDGSDPQAIIGSQDGPWGVAVDANYVYWANAGTPPTPARSPGRPRRLRSAGHRHRPGRSARGGGRRQLPLLGQHQRRHRPPGQPRRQQPADPRQRPGRVETGGKPRRTCRLTRVHTVASHLAGTLARRLDGPPPRR